MLDYDSFELKRFEKLNKGSIAQLFERLKGAEKRELYKNKKFVSCLNQDELASLASEKSIIKDLVEDSAVLKKFPTITFPIPRHLKWNDGTDYFNWLCSRLKKSSCDFAWYGLLREHLICLGEKRTDLAKKIIGDTCLLSICRKRKHDVNSPLVRLAVAHEIIANSLLSPFENRELLSPAERVKLGVTYESRAKSILYNTLFGTKLEPAQYAELAHAHECAGRFVFEEIPNIGYAFNEEQLTTCARSPFNAKWLLALPLEKLSNNILREIAISDHSLANKIFEEKDLFNKLNPVDIVQIAQAHLPIAERVISTTHLREKLDEEDLGLIALAHWQMIQATLSTSGLRPKLTVDSRVRIAEKYITYENFKFDIPSLLDELDSTSLKDFGKNHIFVAEYILKSPSLVAKLNASDLREIQRTVELYNNIMQTLGINNNDELYEKSWENLDPHRKTISYEELKSQSPILHQLQRFKLEPHTKDQTQQQTPKTQEQSHEKRTTSIQSQTTEMFDEVILLSKKRRQSWRLSL